MRIALAKVMVHRPDHLLLDEPTNHLDTAARDWLSADLAEYRGTILIVTHDAEFLDQVSNRILELRDCEIKTYAGNYSDYQRIKAERLTALDQAASRQERELVKQQRFIDRFRAKQSKATVVKSREKAVAKIERVCSATSRSRTFISISRRRAAPNRTSSTWSTSGMPTTTTWC